MARILWLILGPGLAPLSGDVGGLGGRVAGSGVSLAL